MTINSFSKKITNSLGDKNVYIYIPSFLEPCSLMSRFRAASKLSVRPCWDGNYPYHPRNHSFKITGKNEMQRINQCSVFLFLCWYVVDTNTGFNTTGREAVFSPELLKVS